MYCFILYLHLEKLVRHQSPNKPSTNVYDLFFSRFTHFPSIILIAMKIVAVYAYFKSLVNLIVKFCCDDTLHYYMIDGN